MIISSKYGNILLVDGKFVTVGQCDLSEVFNLAHNLIERTLPEFPTMWIMHLGQANEVFVPDFNVAPGVFTSPDGLQPYFLEVWQQVIEHGHTPQIRAGSAVFGTPSGMHLLVARP